MQLISGTGSVGITTGYEADARPSIPGRCKDSSVLRSVQTGSEAHPSSYRRRALSPGVLRLAREADHSPPSSAEVKNVRAVSSSPPRSSCRGA
jgi:hypothetical protein